MTKVFGAIVFGAIFVLSVFSIIDFEKTYAEESVYKMAENVEAKFSFIFRDAVEMHNFPVFKMTSDFVANDGTTFAIEGMIGNSPYLHKALDEAYKNRVMTSTGASSFEHDFRFFDVDVDLMRDGETIRILHYYNCEILDYEAITLESGDYESYHSAKSGFSVVDKIDFRCGGINGESPKDAVYQDIDYSEIYSFAEDVRTFITFEHDDGIEKVEFTAFKLNSGFEESDESVPASFSVEGALNHYSLLYKAMDKARKVSGLGTAYNNDFDALVEFSNGKKTLRSLDFKECRVSGAIINTESDKEESYNGKSGFAIVNEIDFDCAGLNPMNKNYDSIKKEGPVWMTTFMENQQTNEALHMADGLRVMTTFTYNNGIEQIQFPVFRQGDVLAKANPTFQLEGIVGDYPLLYKRVDDNLKIQSVSGANSMTELFDVDVNLVTGELVRGFNYSNCRVIDYDVDSAMNNEENYIKGLFAIENTFEFECQGYHPNNPMYDYMFNSHAKSNTISSKDLSRTDDWEPGFFVE